MSNIAEGMTKLFLIVASVLIISVPLGLWKLIELIALLFK